MFFKAIQADCSILLNDIPTPYTEPHNFIHFRLSVKINASVSSSLFRPAVQSIV